MPSSPGKLLLDLKRVVLIGPHLSCHFCPTPLCLPSLLPLTAVATCPSRAKGCRSLQLVHVAFRHLKSGNSLPKSPPAWSHLAAVTKVAGGECCDMRVTFRRPGVAVRRRAGSEPLRPFWFGSCFRTYGASRGRGTVLVRFQWRDHFESPTRAASLVVSCPSLGVSSA